MLITSFEIPIRNDDEAVRARMMEESEIQTQVARAVRAANRAAKEFGSVIIPSSWDMVIGEDDTVAEVSVYGVVRYRKALL